MTNRYHDENKKKVNTRGKIAADVEYKNNEQKVENLITERKKTTTLSVLDENFQNNHQIHAKGREQPVVEKKFSLFVNG